MIQNINNGYVEVPLKLLVHAAWNYKIEDEVKTEKLIANIKKNGQIENIIIRKLSNGYYEIVNGNHRYDAMLKLGMEKAMCYNLGEISDATAKRIAVETNETKFDSDDFKLANVINDILQEFDEGDLLDSFPFDEHDIKSYVSLMDYSFNELESEYQKDVDRQDAIDKLNKIANENKAEEDDEFDLTNEVPKQDKPKDELEELFEQKKAKKYFVMINMNSEVKDIWIAYKESLGEEIDDDDAFSRMVKTYGK